MGFFNSMTKAKAALRRWSESAFLALATSPGLQLGARVASLRCPILRLARWQINATEQGREAANLPPSAIVALAN